MQVSRREFLKLGGAMAAVSVAPSVANTGYRQRPDIRWAARTPAQMPEPDLATLLLNRAAFGPRPGDVEAVRGNELDWIEQQLAYEAIDNTAVEDRIREELPTVFAAPRVLLGIENRSQPIRELHAATLYRMIFSPRLLHEVMVEFWSDHFAIYHLQNQCPYLKTVDDREVIRPNALGNFKTLLTASAQSPAMLNFLDNDTSTKARPNENYAREIMELHTTGSAVDGYPYTEEDVKEVARCFTGWSWDQRDDQVSWGEFEFRFDQHDNGGKQVLGGFIPPSGGESDGHQVIDILIHHEATAKYIAFKLVRRLVTDDPVGEVPELLANVERAYVMSDGDVQQMVRTILHSREFANSFAGYGGRLSRPMDLIARTVRALGAEAGDLNSIQAGMNHIIGGRGFLSAMGHLPFYWSTPDGYPDTKEAWTASATMLARWNLGLAAVGVGADNGVERDLIRGFRPGYETPAEHTTAGAVVDYWTDQLLHRQVLDADRQILVDYLTEGGTEFDTLTATQRERVPETVALILDSPYFQWR